MDSNSVFFKGPPVWRVNLPYIVLCNAVATLLCFEQYWAGLHGWVAPWWLLASLLAALGLAVAARVIKTLLIDITIDRERLTVRSGFFTRRAASVELYRIQNVESVSVWWQRLLGFGTLIVYSSDVTHPIWNIPGMVDLENRREALNRAAIALRDAKGIRELNFGSV